MVKLLHPCVHITVLFGFWKNFFFVLIHLFFNSLDCSPKWCYQDCKISWKAEINLFLPMVQLVLAKLSRFKETVSTQAFFLELLMVKNFSLFCFFRSEQRWCDSLIEYRFEALLTILFTELLKIIYRIPQNLTSKELFKNLFILFVKSMVFFSIFLIKQSLNQHTMLKSNCYGN